MSLYQKVIDVVSMLRNSIGQRALKTDLAREFSESKNYTSGRLVYRNGTLYVCRRNHSGVWIDDDFEETTIDEALSSKESASPFKDNLYLKDEDGKFHKVLIEMSDDVYVLSVDQESEEP